MKDDTGSRGSLQDKCPIHGVSNKSPILGARSKSPVSAMHKKSLMHGASKSPVLGTHTISPILRVRTKSPVHGTCNKATKSAMKSKRNESDRSLSKSSKGDNSNPSLSRSREIIFEDLRQFRTSLHDAPKRRVERVQSTPLVVGSQAIGRSQTCKNKSYTNKLDGLSPCRPRFQSMVEGMGVLSRFNTLASIQGLNALNQITNFAQSNLQSMELEDGTEIYRVRSFTTTNKGIVNCGDSYKLRSPETKQSLLKRRQDSAGTLDISQTWINTEGLRIGSTSGASDLLDPGGLNNKIT